MDASWAKVLTDWMQYLITGAVGGGFALWATLGRRDRRHGEALRAVQGDLAQYAERLVHAEIRAESVPDRCHGHLTRLAGIEEAIKRGPHHGDLAKLGDESRAGLVRVHERVDRMEKALGRIEATLSGVERTVGKIDLYLTEHGPRAGEAHR